MWVCGCDDHSLSFSSLQLDVFSSTFPFHLLPQLSVLTAPAWETAEELREEDLLGRKQSIDNMHNDSKPPSSTAIRPRAPCFGWPISNDSVGWSATETQVDLEASTKASASGGRYRMN